MGSNVFGKLFRITTWGESHGPAVGVVIDGCPAGLALTEEEICEELAWRRPGHNAYTSPRYEQDAACLLSGVFEGKTTGAPIAIEIANCDVKTEHYDSLKNVLRPGHANFAYLEKYGCFDYRGGGRASARETACRVAAGAVAKKLLAYFDIHLVAYLRQMGEVKLKGEVTGTHEVLRAAVRATPLFCPDVECAQAMGQALLSLKEDSWGGIVECLGFSIPPGLGDPVYEKLNANLAQAMLSIPAAKGIEFGCGFASAAMRGSVYNDIFKIEEGEVTMQTNHAGGTLGGISTGMPLIWRVAFKPTSSIAQPQQSVTLEHEPATYQPPPGSRHDPCVAIRAVPVVEAMGALVLADALLMHRCARLAKEI